MSIRFSKFATRNRYHVAQGQTLRSSGGLGILFVTVVKVYKDRDIVKVRTTDGKAFWIFENELYGWVAVDGVEA